MASVADLAEQGWRLLITHGNGPQVGFIMRRSEIARQSAGMHIVPLASCVADTQGALGYQIQQALGNELILMIKASALASVVTVFDLMGVTSLAYGRSFNFQVFFWAALMYLIMVEAVRRVWTLIEARLTRHLRRIEA